MLIGQQAITKVDRDNRQQDGRQESVFNTFTPGHGFDIILGRPTNNSVTLSVLSYLTAEVYVAYSAPGESAARTTPISLIKNEPAEIILDNLKASTLYHYLICYRPSGANTCIESDKFHFQTQRSRNEGFTFTITADSHLDQNSDPLTYKATLLNALGDSADFHIDLGDTFMTDKYRGDYREALAQYIAQRYYFGLLCNSSPLFFVQGNHDGESGQKLNGKSDNMAVWSNLTRREYFPNPFPNDFYTGNSKEEPFVGRPENYYAWEWGNALFVVLDPFWNTPREGADLPWERTLGKRQYDWLKTTLENSRAIFKFVFIHNLVGGTDLKGRARGGTEVAGLCEWGGRNSDGTEGFHDHRQGWDMPIHKLLVKNNVAVVFHGHDHRNLSVHTAAGCKRIRQHPAGRRVWLQQRGDYERPRLYADPGFGE
jgi:hypothetical protein